MTSSGTESPRGPGAERARMAAIRQWCAAHAHRFVGLPEVEGFEAMTEEVHRLFYPARVNLWHREADRVHQLVLASLSAERG